VYIYIYIYIIYIKQIYLYIYIYRFRTRSGVVHVERAEWTSSWDSVCSKIWTPPPNGGGNFVSLNMEKGYQFWEYIWLGGGGCSDGVPFTHGIVLEFWIMSAKVICGLLNVYEWLCAHAFSCAHRIQVLTLVWHFATPSTRHGQCWQGYMVALLVFEVSSRTSIDKEWFAPKIDKEWFAPI